MANSTSNPFPFAFTNLDGLETIRREYLKTDSVQYIGIAGHIAVVFDFLHTFPDEVRLMWPAPMSTPKFLFLLVRYYLLFHRIPAIYLAMPTTHSPETCKVALIWTTMSCFMIAVVSEAILFIRVHAFSGRNKRLGIYLILQFIAIHGTGIGLLILFLRSAKFVPLPIPNLPCTPIAIKDEYLSGVFGTVLISLLLVMLIMMYIAYRKHQNLRSDLFTLFYRDGVFYFICLSALAVANIAVTLSPVDGRIRFVLGQVEIDLHGILSTRMLLHLRRCAEREAGKWKNTDAIEYSSSDHPWRENRASLSAMRFQSKHSTLQSE